MSDDTRDPAAGPSAGEYEFGAEESQSFDRLARVMGWAGAALMLFGLFQIVAGAVQPVVSDEVTGVLLSDAVITIVGGFVAALVGFWTRRASGWFQLIADTRGADLTHLLNAIDDLISLYRVQGWMVGLSLAVIAASLVYLVIALL